jgi:hypothetical protein
MWREQVRRSRNSPVTKPSTILGTQQERHTMQVSDQVQKQVPDYPDFRVLFRIYHPELQLPQHYYNLLPLRNKDYTPTEEDIAKAICSGTPLLLPLIGAFIKNHILPLPLNHTARRRWVELLKRPDFVYTFAPPEILSDQELLEWVGSQNFLK